MQRVIRRLTQLQVLPTDWATTILLVLLGFAGGLLAAGYVWAKSGYEYLPAEIIVKPPPPNVTICFPDRGFAGAINLQAELARQMNAQKLRQYNKEMVNSSIKACLAESDSLYDFHVLNVRPTGFNIIAVERWGFAPRNNYTLLTEKGCYYLHSIPKRRSADYNSLLIQRQQAWH
ncbi:MAG TPA: hypothetical protein VFO93_07990 [Hymenobacter sp.]|uniref:hypothetical protein n=1 Tax=Hymenobacter sp. TaxID=1898978 RepID=UPI002D7E29F4|nr:hypothetical protein [Hymenobacter sp.]HET9503466.1 hypothetical protein [Hymenobacter sp.]